MGGCASADYVPNSCATPTHALRSSCGSAWKLCWPSAFTIYDLRFTSYECLLVLQRKVSGLSGWEALCSDDFSRFVAGCITTKVVTTSQCCAVILISNL